MAAMTTRALRVGLLLATGLACASRPPPPAPVRPVGKDVLLAWTIERGLYDRGVRRSTEVVTIRSRAGQGELEVQDFGVVHQDDAAPRTPRIHRRALTVAEMDGLNRTLFGLELPDVDRRREAPAIVPWTLWGICFPTTRSMQCGQLLADEWKDVRGAPELFALLETLREQSADR
jgi:hypothetical protein